MRAASKKAGEREATPAAAGVGAPGQSRRPKRPKVKQASREESAGAGLRPGELARAAVARTRPGRPCVGMGQADAEPADGFAGLGLAPELAQHLGSLGFAVPTPVQAACIPALLDGQDVLANAPTGSGKTLAYLAPIVSELARRAQRVTREQGTLALVVCPTRELALQVENVLGALLRRFFWLVGSSVHGGESRSREKARLRKGVHVLVATPGRLLDHLQNTEAFRVDALAWLVLDEADRLLDLGFGKKIAEILGLLDERRDGAQTLRRVTALFSATLHSGVERLAGLSLRKPMHIGLEDSTATGHSAVPGSPAEDAAAPLVPGAANGAAQVQQYVIPPQLRQFYVEVVCGGGCGWWEVLDHKALFASHSLTRFPPASPLPHPSSPLTPRVSQVPCKLRFVALAAFLRARLAAPAARILVFLSTRDSVEFYHAVLHGAWQEAVGQLQSDDPLDALPVLKLHGDMDQASRTKAFAAFMRSPRGVLLCTDVAARGLDFPGVTATLQVDPPGDAGEYVHRVGRAARGGAAGEAVLFLQPGEAGYVGRLAERGVRLAALDATRLLDGALGLDRRAGKLARDERGLPLERHQGAYALQRRLMGVVAADAALTALAAAAFRSWVRAYAAHPAAVKDIFHVKRLHLGHVAHSFALT
ncbi:hypothetical protein APUTEX25_004251 [Auxenochlorella protothecoides]|uniref:ATP-dependent RNA helicase n=1 Tax=Auxenochlorella protothecoides TaxID=3075 RepID=A0A3M7L4A3_AUXPR|nr:hypothetical protein APUTEX25_004251 [Auxenochlorella protothecoides]|eukprot:RMZ57417.1 hypothetical protein APUTEX25_004251 [Auxenochlorella protothecoides]